MLRSDNLIPLTGGAYQARSAIADYEVCENLFPEINPQDTESPVAVTHYPREGKRLLSSPPVAGAGRGVFSLSNGKLIACVGSDVYAIDGNWNWSLLGTISSDSSTPIAAADNGTSAVIVDGTGAGYEITMATGVFAPIIDNTGTFQGSNCVDFADTFLAFSPPGTNEWMVTLSNQVAFNALIIANKDSTPDPILAFAFNLRQMWLFGTKNTEIWFLAGTTPFPYEEWPNIFVPYGIAALYSLVRADINLYWISRNAQGEVIALSTNGYGTSAISTRALEYEWSTYTTIADAIGGVFQQGGHTFVIFHFPTADRTWAFDLATKQWHRRTFIDANGVPHRENVSFYAAVSENGGYPPTIIGQAWKTGEIYALDPKVYLDGTTPIVCRRTFPHVLKDMHEITHVSFVADFETGGISGVGENGAGSGDPWSPGFSPGFGPFAQGDGGPKLFMRYSNDGGASWKNYRSKGLIGSGKYRSMMRWRGLGMARDRVYELMWSYPGPSALQGAYLDPIEHSA